MLKTLRENRKHPLPLRAFEVSDIAYQDPTDEQRLTRNERRVCATYTDKEARFEVVHGLLDKIMRSLDIPFIGRSNQGKTKGYWIAEGNDPTFLPGRSAVIKFRPGPSSTPITNTVPASESTVQAAAVSSTETGT
ncbi:hypothetical protein, partial [Corallococcus sp. CA041A]|uniref:hypothetical protein n=1 Tax=Corallococcus sp. CA041A TaxID=2316727 RepID=UPI001F25C762